MFLEILHFETESYQADPLSPQTAVPETDPGPQSQAYTAIGTDPEPEPGTERGNLIIFYIGSQ